MDRQQILDLYDWQPGVCFRHPGNGEVPTALVKVVHAIIGEREVRACEACVIAIEDARREMAARSGREYEPGQVADGTGWAVPTCRKGGSLREESGSGEV